MELVSASFASQNGQWYDLAGREVPPTASPTEELIKLFSNIPPVVVVPAGYGEVRHLQTTFAYAGYTDEWESHYNYLLLTGGDVDRVGLALPRLVEYTKGHEYSFTAFASRAFDICGNALTTVSIKSEADSYPTLIAVRVGSDIFVKIPHQTDFTSGAIAALIGDDMWLIGQYTCPMTSLVRQVEEEPANDTSDELEHPCDNCGEEEQEGGREHTYIDQRGEEHQLCSWCAMDYQREFSTRICEDCGCMVHRNVAYSDGFSTTLCPSCYEGGDYATCNQCGRIVHADGIWYHEGTDQNLCEPCYDDTVNSEGPIRHYHDRPKYQWYKTPDDDQSSGILYLGTECEWSTNNKQWELADFLCENLYGCDNESRFFLMHDASLCDGVECISMPHTLGAWLKLRPDLSGIAEQIAEDYHKPGKSDGMHVHVSRKGMTETHEKCFIALFDLCQKEWEAFARRADKHDSYYMYMRMASSCFGLSIDMEDADAMLEGIQELMDRARNRCVNAIRSNTLEVRIFQTPATTQQWYAAIEAVHAAYQFTKGMTWDKLWLLYQHDLLWSEFVRFASTDPRYTDLREGLKNVLMPAEAATPSLAHAI